MEKVMKRLMICLISLAVLGCGHRPITSTETEVVQADKGRNDRAPNTEFIFTVVCPIWSNQCAIHMYGYVLGTETYYPYQAEMIADYMNANSYDMKTRFASH